MFFRKPANMEIKPDDLESYNLKMFYTLISPMEKQADAAEASIISGIAGFKESIANFSNSRSDPEMEYIPNYSIEFVKSQKENYCKRLERILDRSFEEEDGRDAYYNLLLKEHFYSGMLDSILKHNAKFRPVVIGYAKDIDSFKKVYSNIEKRINDLKNVIKSKSNEYDRYIEIRDKIDALLQLISDKEYLMEENAKIKEEVREVEMAEVKENSIKELNSEISEKSNEIVVLQDRISGENSKITAILYPLKRLARKYDYISGEKISLSDFLDNPYILSDPGNYSLFLKELNSLKDMVMKGRIEVKKKESFVEQIEEVVNAGLADRIKNLMKVKEELSELQGSLNEARIGVSTEKSIEEDKHARKEQAKENDGKIAEMDLKIEEICKELELLFNKYYKSLIKITI
ncbi:hypothetical protein Mia14_0491 [Candidatus Mancarchaeum acidiphilum]|uniref:Uncharacterized protein n=1 Tax=Candidatus Mancarchaeum acidiphilum TaxID=1920749 RepID=A0A218NMV5_9ARCH|nr:hypothetical protein [Candidatus Mancarchaeum acidiphilum]ASI13805.1 hypothetical protein Mia14_0491 [Candidatus Mancarchaeum acidiphilum]